MNRRFFLKAGLTGGGTMLLADNAWALKYYPVPSDKKWAVLYGTWCGSSRDAAVWISEGMGGIADAFDVREEPDLKGFDHVVIGGSIRSGATSEQLQKFLRDNKGWLKEKVRGIFAVCGNMRNPVGPQQTTQFIDNHLAKLSEVAGAPSKVFLGRVTKSLMDPQSAKTMASMEDYDNLKRSECMAFGQEVLAKMKA
jgi:menaquinone-dependent protoporphyrinogen IX oxidase